MPNIPKPELEQGAYICYANEPDTIFDNTGGGGGGGGVAIFVANIDDPSAEEPVYIPEFSFNDVKNAFLDGKAVFVRSYLQTDEVISGELNPVYTFFGVAAHNEYGVLVTNNTFVASDPDAIMTQQV